MLDLCHPNVVFVGKIVSPDIQESIFAKGMTFVFDMKRHRLERVARYTGSPILSPDTMMSKNLKQCDSFHIEYFIEGHAGGGGKELSKTLMFIEDSCASLGCTVGKSPAPSLLVFICIIYTHAHTHSQLTRWAEPFLFKFT